LRLLPILIVPNLNQPDELYQSIEQAHRLVYGTGIVPWEFQLGARSYLVPSALAGVMEMARLAGDGPRFYLPAIFGTLAALSTACVPVAYLWARRAYGTAGALVAAAAMALSVDAIYFGPRAGQEELAAHLLVLAAFAAAPGTGPLSHRRAIVAGILFGLVFTVRYHLAPAVALVMVWSSWGAWRERLMPMMGGALAAMLASGAVDWVSWGYPFASLWRNVDYNLFYGVNAAFGAASWRVYPALLAYYGSVALPFILVLAVLGTRQRPMLAAAAVLIVIQYALLPHKELRLIYPSLLLVSMLAALGLARVAAAAASWLRAKGHRPAMASLAAICLWAALALGEAASPGYGALWRQDEDALRAALQVASLPNVCGVGLYRIAWYWSGGYSYMHFAGALYVPADEAALAHEAPGFDVLMYRGARPASPGFETRQCFGETCLARRAGSCAPVPGAFTAPLPAALAP
jgi:GPI mannosyltransferase 3